MVERLGDLLMGPSRGGDHLQAVMFIAAASGAVMHPIVADLDDEVLRSELLVLAQRFR